ncbi:hypothetical protein HWV23_02830 [Natronomonas halophila]|uniref:hypothetical protein n=1 Tax=Natronomonas halophila TaxID=2747817 RepID=UPI0015B4F616|nr:hypothetical protein [Natronomonas halophila]QLD84637.1 hypothetical protein HWV23_02555 [Natronomonas halophila]QLD84691.1 hypothetical protein HWV23_02830 [Natronomonas halophila]
MSDADDVRERIERYVANHPDADRWEVLGKLELEPGMQDLVDDVLDEATQESDDEPVIVDTIPAQNYNRTCANPYCDEPRVNPHPDSLCEKHHPGDPNGTTAGQQVLDQDLSDAESVTVDEDVPDGVDRDISAEAEAIAGYEPESKTQPPGSTQETTSPEPASAGDNDDVDADSLTAADFMGGSDSPVASDDTSSESAPTMSAGQVATPTSVLPLAQLESLSPKERRRAAKKRGLEWPTTDELRDRLEEKIHEVIRHEDKRVVDAPTSAGKSYTIDSTRWGAYDHLTDDRPVVHLLPTRDARNEAAEVAREEGGEHFVFRARHEACPVAAGNFDPDPDDEDDDLVLTIDGQPASEWIQEVCQGRGVTFSDAHRWLEAHNDQGVDLPCKEEGKYEHDCDAIAQWDDWRDNEYPLVIATHNFAHVPGLRNQTNLVIDEQPDFSHDLTTERVKGAVAAFLEEVGAHLDTWEEFWSVATADHPKERLADLVADDVEMAAQKRGLVVSEYRDALLEELYDQLQRQPDREWYYSTPRAHTLAGPLARAILTSEQRAGGRRVGRVSYEPVRLDSGARDDDGWNREWLTVVFDSRNELQQTWTTPDMGLTRSVIGLDAHPALPIWQLQVHPEIQRRKVLDVDERRLWRRFERGLRVVQVGDATRPLASGKYFNVEQTEVIVEHLREEYGDDFRTAITTSAVEDDLEGIMRDYGVPDPETMHYGEEKSRNDFGDESVGYVLGALDPGDGMVMDVVAALDLDAEPERSDPDDLDDETNAHCESCDGAGCHDCHGTGLKRARGREFKGQDADTAQEILASVRENHVAQSAGRYARNPDDPSSTATVFVETDALPTGFADVQVPGTIQTWTSMQSDVLEALRNADEPQSARDLAREAGVSKQHAYETLERAAEFDVIDAIQGVGSHGATLYSDDGTPNAGVVDLGDDIVSAAVQDPTYTWALAITDPDHDSTIDYAPDDVATGGDDAIADGDDPPRSD